MYLKKLFGLRIKEYRKKRDLTQAQLAELVSVEGKHISRIEAGHNFPSAELIGRLAKALSVEPKDLFEFYHHQEAIDLKESISQTLEVLTDEQLKATYKYIRSFVL